MSRRDTIIIAVLVNAALLIVLFVTAIRSGRDEVSSPSLKTNMQLAEKKVETPQTQEELLNQFITPMPTLAESNLVVANNGISSGLQEEIPITFPLTEATPITEDVAAVQPAMEETPAAPAPSAVNVTVKKGDFLEKIAKANGTTVAAIMKANNLSSTQLKIGQVLKMPHSGSKKPVEKQSKPAVSSAEEFYVVKEGDNPWLIASRNHLKLNELLRLNQLDEQKAKKLRPGDKLKIR